MCKFLIYCSYNAIHDPTITMVSISIQVEGAVDILSCTTLMALSLDTHLPQSIRGAIVLCCLLEILNAYQSFGLQILLSGGHDDTPKDLVKWKAYLRFFRGFIDLICLVLRTILWIEYDALSVVFLIKNLYNILNTSAQVERGFGVDKYPGTTLFVKYVEPHLWYGMDAIQWRNVTTTSTEDLNRLRLNVRQ